MSSSFEDGVGDPCCGVTSNGDRNGPVPRLSKRMSRLKVARASGFSRLVDVELGRGGKLFAFSQGDERTDVPYPPSGDPATPNSGELWRANKDGTFSVVVDKLNLPTSLELVEDTAFVVTLTGEVWRIEDVSKLDRSRPDRDDDRHEVDRY